MKDKTTKPTRKAGKKAITVSLKPEVLDILDSICDSRSVAIEILALNTRRIEIDSSQAARD